VRQDIGKDVEAVKNQNRQETHNSAIALLSFPILRSEFYRYRQNPNGTINYLFQFEPSETAHFFIANIWLFSGSFEINPAWPFGQREGHHSGRRKRVNSFFKKNLNGLFFLFRKISRLPREARFHQHLRTFRHSGSELKKNSPTRI